MLSDEINKFLDSPKYLDYISVKCSGDGCKVTAYYNDVKSDDPRAREFLCENTDLGVLFQDGSIQCYSTQEGENVAYSFEYKLKYIPVNDRRFSLLMPLWEEGDRPSIRRFAKRRRRGNALYGGIYWFGMELPKGRPETGADIRKIYFRTCFTDPQGEDIFDDVRFADMISGSGIPQLCEIVDLASELLRYGFHLYMVAWNWDRFLLSHDYKIYFSRQKECDAEGIIDGLCNAMHYSVSLRNELKAVLRDAKVQLMGFAVGIGTDGSRRVNFYFKEKRV